MRAVWVDNKQIAVRDIEPPAPAEGEVLVRVRLAGICSTDLEIVKGYGGFTGVLGHEFVGTVESTSSKLAGRRVVCEINCVCGRCDMCQRGLANHCRRRSVIGIVGRNGAFAELIAVPERNCHVVPEGVSDEEAVFTEPLAAAYQILRQVPMDKKTSVAVVGTGRLGLLIAQVLAKHAGQVIGIGRNPKTLAELDRQRIRSMAVDQIAQFETYDIVVEATGSPEGLPLAMRLVRPRGTIVLKTTSATSAALDLTPLVVNEITVVGSRCGPFGDALNALARKEIDVTGMISRTLPLAEATKAMTLAAQPDHIKILLKPGA